MAKFRVTQECDYVQGHLRYGHMEGIIEADSLEDAKRKVEEEGYNDYLDIVVDDYEVDSYDSDRNPYEYEEIKEE